MENIPEINSSNVLSLSETKPSYPTKQEIDSKFESIIQKLAIKEQGGNLAGISDVVDEIVAQDITPNYIKELLKGANSPGHFGLDDFMIDDLEKGGQSIKKQADKLHLNYVEEYLCLQLLNEVKFSTFLYYQSQEKPDNPICAYDKMTDEDLIKAVAYGDKPISQVRASLLNTRAIQLHGSDLGVIHNYTPMGSIGGMFLYSNEFIIYKPEQSTNAYRLIKLIADANNDIIPMDANFHQKQGEYFGYPPKKIDAFISNTSSVKKQPI